MQHISKYLNDPQYYGRNAKQQTSDCKGYAGKNCYSETKDPSGYCFDCVNRRREDTQHIEQDCMRCEETYHAPDIYEYCPKCRDNMNRYADDRPDGLKDAL